MSKNLKNKCTCDNLKDKRSEECRTCSAKRRWYKYNIQEKMQTLEANTKRIKNRRSFVGENNPMFGKKRLDVIIRNKNTIGKNHPRYIDGRTNKKYYCLDCREKITITSAIYGLGRCESCSKKDKLNNMYGKKVKFTKQVRNKIRKRRLGQKHTKETKKKISLSKGGTGIPYENNEYPAKFFKIRNKILKRDNYICQLCLEYGNEVHHIDYNKNNNDEENLCCLCHKCNIRANYNRRFWTKYYNRLIYKKV